MSAEVRKEFPDVYITTYAYANRDIPAADVKPDDHVAIASPTIMCCTRHAFDDEHCWMRSAEGRMLKRWCELCPNVFTRSYIEHMLVTALTPSPEVHRIRREIPLVKKWGLIGFTDGARLCWAEAGIMSPGLYLRARLEWDADADADAILDDFYANWYGRAAAPMREFWEAIEDAFDNATVHGHEDAY